MSRHIVDDEQRRDRRATPRRPSGSGPDLGPRSGPAAGTSAALTLLEDVHPHRLRRAALQLPPPGQESDPFYYSERLLVVKRHTMKAVLKGWSPFILASILIFIYAVPSLSSYLKFKSLNFPLPGLHNLVMRVPPAVPQLTPEEAKMNLNFLALPGTAIFLAAFIAAPCLGLSFRKAWLMLIKTIKQLAPSLLAISFMVGLAYLTRYSGMDTTIGLSLTRTGWIFPLFGTLLGWIGVALTGTDAGSNALFGNLQKVTAEQLHISPVLMGSANSAGGVMGKMISPQSLVVATAATNQAGKEAEMFKVIFRHSITLAILVGLLVMFYAYVAPGLVR
jgi:lactate permease